MIKKIVLILLALVGLAIAVLLLSIPFARFESPQQTISLNNTQPLVLGPLNVVDVISGEIVPNQRVVIEDGRIALIQPMGNDVAAPFSIARIVNTQGAYLTPGLFDMHVHLHDRAYLMANLAHGVTTVRNLRGLPMHLRWRDEIARGEWLGSDLITSSPVLDGPKYAHLLQQVVTDPDHARELVRRYHGAGYDSIKAYGYLGQPEFAAVVDEAKRLNFPVVKHGPNRIEGGTFAELEGMQSLEHVEDIFQGPLDFKFDESELNQWIDSIMPLEPFITPTLATFEHLTLLSERKEAFTRQLPLENFNPLYRELMRGATVKRWLDADADTAKWNRQVLNHLMRITEVLDQRGIRLLAGSDAGTMFMPPGASLHDELRLLEAAGLSPLTVLQAATLNAATALNIDDEQGHIAEGVVANLVLTQDNPLSNLNTLRTPVGVVKSGHYLDESALAELRTMSQSPANFYAALGRFLEDILGRMFH